MQSCVGISLKTIIKYNYYCACRIPNFQLQWRKTHKISSITYKILKDLIYKDNLLVIFVLLHDIFLGYFGQLFPTHPLQQKAAQETKILG